MLGVYNKFIVFLWKTWVCLSRQSSRHDWEPALLKGEHITEPKDNKEVYRGWKWGQVTWEECRCVAQACRAKPKLSWIWSWWEIQKVKGLLQVPHQQNEDQQKCGQLLNGVVEKDQGKHKKVPSLPQSLLSRYFLRHLQVSANWLNLRERITAHSERGLYYGLLSTLEVNT